MELRSLLIIAGFGFACFSSCKNTEESCEVTLKGALANKFLMGVAINDNQASGRDSAGAQLIIKHFNSVAPENCMKSEVIHPEEERYDFTQSDRFVAFGEKYNMKIIGHTLIWHSQLAPWFCVDENGKNVSKEVLKERMKEHITTIVSRYKGKIKGWDVVNEAFEDDGSYRKTKFYEILGEDYLPLAFKFAHQADPDAELYYNDYSMAHKGRRGAVVNMIKKFQEQGIRIDAIGMQAHLSMDFPKVEDFETSLLAFAAAGVKVMVTELDLTILPSPRPNMGADVSANFDYQKEMNPYPDMLPDSVSKAWNARMEEFFKLFIKHSDKVTRVTVWGATDADSWKNNWPIKGRTDYPVLFDRNNLPKPVVNKIINEVSPNESK
jgi:endo-1,4-beta-xylanase